MKKLITLLTTSILFVGFLVAAPVVEPNSLNRGISLGTLWQSSLRSAGGSFEFGFPATHFEHKGFLFRNYIVASGEGSNGFGAASIGDKIAIGGYIPNSTFAISSYGFIQANVGFTAGPGVETKATVGATTGGGFEFQFSQFSAFVTEFCGIFPLIKNDFQKPSPCLTIGYRAYL